AAPAREPRAPLRARLRHLDCRRWCAHPVGCAGRHARPGRHLQMIIVLKPDVPPRAPELERLLQLAKSFPGISTEVHRIEGAPRSLTEVSLLGPTHAVPTRPFEELEIVEKVVRITQKYRFIGRHDPGLESVGFEHNGVRISQESLTLFPGLCAVDTRE